ncbi:MAG: DUF5615 family PIN-like protein [Caldilineaceae bacterium]
MARLYADENFPQPVVDELRRIGHDVLTIQADGKSNQKYPDELVLRDATLYKRSVLTINRKDFRRLHLQMPGHGGIISCTYNPDFSELARCIDQAIVDLDSLAGRLILVYRPG